MVLHSLVDTAVWECHTRPEFYCFALLRILRHSYSSSCGVTVILVSHLGANHSAYLCDGLNQRRLVRNDCSPPSQEF